MLSTPFGYVCPHPGCRVKNHAKYATMPEAEKALAAHLAKHKEART